MHARAAATSTEETDTYNLTVSVVRPTFVIATGYYQDRPLPTLVLVHDFSSSSDSGRECDAGLSAIAERDEAFLKLRYRF